jgi:hypothetical protein
MEEPIPNSHHSIVHKDAPSFRFASCGGKNFQFQVNNTLYPNWTSDKLVDYWQHTKLAVGDQGNMLSGSFPQTISHYMQNFFVYACQLEHRTDGGSQMTAAGWDFSIISDACRVEPCSFRTMQGSTMHAARVAHAQLRGTPTHTQLWVLESTLPGLS